MNHARALPEHDQLVEVRRRYAVVNLEQNHLLHWAHRILIICPTALQVQS